MLASSPDDSITLHYQPLADRRGTVIGFEALMRWHHQMRGPISPEAFIPIFESSGLILPLSRWALRQACRDAASWKRPLQVSVNLSAVQFQQDDVPAMVAAVLADTGLAPERLELEVTAACIDADPDRTGSALRELAGQGVRLALDDTSGDPALRSQLEDYPFSRVKIAQALVHTVAASASARSLVQMILFLGRSLHVSVAAKGIETHGQLAFMLEQGCDVIQGFFVGRPAPMAAFAGVTGNVEGDFIAGSTRLADGARLIVPLHAGELPPDAMTSHRQRPQVHAHP